MERTRQRPEQIQGGSRTITIEDNQQDVLIPPSQNAPPVGVLQLRASGGNTRRVVWSEETIDNEGMGKKKSKICCIYHKPKAFDESSDESSGSNSESEASNSDKDDKDTNSHSSNSIHDSDSEKEDEVNASKSLRDRKANGLIGKGKAKANNGVDDENCGVKSCKDHHHKKKSKQKSTKVTKGRSTQTITITENENENHDESTRKVKPNAYEKGIW